MGSIYRPCKSNLEERMRKNRTGQPNKASGWPAKCKFPLSTLDGCALFIAFSQLQLVIIFVPLSGPLIFMTGH